MTGCGSSGSAGGMKSPPADQLDRRLGLGYLGRTRSRERPRPARHARPGAATAMRVDERAVDRVRRGVERRGQRRVRAEAVTRRLVGEGELENDTPGVRVVVPVDGAT